ncbi:E3 ubiquitin-protein ligase RNF166-like [Amphiura filiformis]|uniref:E3 ubiquitin-protein ligase RNF166-like n=1 Tax=Amphiura filiformis TaxID=82378 RepID=UPI003B20DFAD
MATGSSADDEAFKCSICLEIYLKPIKISCEHIFCEECLGPYLDVASPNCPLCRKVFDPKLRSKAKDVEKQIASVKVSCQGCKKKMALSKLRAHNATCKIDAEPRTKFKPIAPTTQKPDSGPNRSTFTCPYCAMRNLDPAELRRHCNKDHADDTAAVVCPVCACMPWGDPNYKSANFLQHLNLRHKFEYETYVDYHQEEDETLEAVLQASLNDK